MKLISCYIEGYGKIKQREYTFERGITTFCEDNGEGKTTLASFIKAMFYGLKSYRKGSVEFCDREHFYPFDGGLFGGNLTFEAGGDIYKLERFFTDKSELGDSLRIYKNGEETTALGEEPGRSVFGVDRESFERTVFLESGDVEMKSTASIQSKLNGFLEGTEGEEDADGAKAALEKAAKVYKKSRVGNDKVTAINAKLLSLSADIDNAMTIKRTLEGKYGQARALQEEIDERSREIVAAQESNERLSQFEHYDSLQIEIKKAETGLENIAERYPMGVPTLEETEALNAYMVRGKELQAKLESVEISPKDRERLSFLQGVFKGGVPTEAELLSIEEKTDRLTSLRAENNLLSASQYTEAEGRLQARFARSQPTEEELQAAGLAVERHKETKTAYEQTVAWTPTKSEAPKSSLVCLLLAVAAFALSVGLFFWNKLVGSALLVLGGVLLIVGVALRGDNAKGGMHGNVENERRRLEGLLRETEDCAKAVLLPYGYHSGNGVAFDFASLQADVAAYRELLQREVAQKNAIAENRQKLEEIEAALTAFFRPFALTGDTYVKRLADLRLLRSDYADLTARERSAAQDRSLLEKEWIENRANVEGYRVKYGLSELTVGRILEDIKEYARLERSVKELTAKATAYRQEKGLGERSSVGKADLSELQARLQSLQGEKSRLDREIAADELEAEKLEGYQADKAEAEELLKEYKRKHKLLSAALELMERAEGRLRDKYVQPIKQEFLRYTDLIERTLGEKIIMTKDFEIRFERNGIERSEKHLSAGQRSICALCFRLALLKNMYREQLPFLILDDPFMALDEGHVEKVAVVLRELSKDMQMVYFTCHESRRI